jgi:tetratricopeptide (TPR) repeat protein
VIGLILVFLCAISGSASAGDDRQTSTLSSSMSRNMFEVQEALQKENYEAALQQLTELLGREDKLKPYDKAKALELLTAVHMSREAYGPAAKAAKRALALNALEEDSVTLLHQRLFYLYFFLEDYPRSIKHIEAWFSREPQPDIQSYFTAAQVYAVSDHMDKALDMALQGMEALRNNPERAPRENWYQLLISIYLHHKQYPEAAGALEEAVSLWPHRANYYLQLSAVYQELKRERESLAILSIAHRNGLVNNESDFERLLQLYRFFEYPFKGASIFRDEMKRENVDATEANWETLANAWQQAREWSRAESVLQRTAELSDTGEHWLRLCRIAFQDERWAEARQYCRQALDKGGLEDEAGTAWYLIALERYYRDAFKKAKQAFARCSRWEKTQKDCEHSRAAAGGKRLKRTANTGARSWLQSWSGNGAKPNARNSKAGRPNNAARNCKRQLTAC